jgi:macrolide transport system ATP-binding/permease protein
MNRTGFSQRLSALLRRRRFRSELDEEMAFHRANAEADFAAQGLSPAEAHRAAARQFGNPALFQDRSQAIVGFRFETILQDLRFALRQLARNPGFTATAVVMLALGIGASVAIFGFVDAALLKPLPYQNPSRLAILFETNTLGPRFHLSYPDYLDWKQRTRSFSSLDTFSPYGFMLKTPDGTLKADGASISAGFFHTLGVSPILGRGFYADEDLHSGQDTVLLSYAAWQNRYAGQPDALGKAVNLDGHACTIIGVLPATFHFAPAEPAEFWRLLQPGKRQQVRGDHGLFGVARLKDGVTFVSAAADVKAVAEQLEKQYPDSNRDRGGWMLPLSDVIVGDVRPILMALLVGSALLLLIATINVTSLLLVRSESRRREVAVRGALGASHARLVRQFVTEGMLLSAAGTVAGVAGASEIMRLVTGLVPKDVLAKTPYLLGLGLNAHVIIFSLAVCLATGLLFAFAPTLRLSLTDLRQGLTEGGRSSAGTLWRRFGANLVVIEIATAMVLLVGAGLLGKSLYRLLHVDAGLVPGHLAMLRGVAIGPRYTSDDVIIALGRQMSQQLGALPGVESVGIANTMPLGDGDGISDFQVVGRPYHGQHDEVANRSVDPGYFRTIQARIVRGRGFLEDEDKTKPRVAIINQTLAKQYFPGEDPIGRRIAWAYDLKAEMEIAGVVSDVQEGQLDAAPRAAIYVNYNQDTSGDFAVVVRTSLDENALLQTMATTIHQIDPGIALFDPETMDQRIHDSPSAYLHRMSAYLVGAFAATALLLSVVGLYGVVAYSVSQRTREIGVRMALGAPRGSVYGMVLKEAARLTGIGVGLGLVCSLAAGSLMRSLLFGTAAWDGATLAAVAILLAGSAMLASYIPARRAAAVNPVEALRAE